MTALLRSIFSVLMMVFGFASVIVAQNADGEFCVRAFEDLNSNGISDLNEPPLQRGVSANLLDANGIVVASALMDSSPQMARGLICFQLLPPGQYTIEVSSGDYTATTGTNMTNVVRAGEVPYVMDYGAVRTNIVGGQAQPEAVNVEAAVPRIAVSLAGAVGAALIMAVLGLLIYLLVYRPRLKRATAAPSDDYYRKPPTTGSIPRVTDTAEIRKR